ncbi:MAG: PTS sugar transporter subunit IIA [Tepidisphaeraceae bacterium]
MKLREFIQTEAVIVSLNATDRDGVIQEMVDELAASGAIDPADVADLVAALVKRERTGTTGFGKGVAVPHAKHPKVSKLIGTVALSKNGVDFNALDHKPVFSVFMVLSPAGQDQLHHQAMEVIFRNLNKDMYRRFLRQADTKEKLIELLDEADAGK